MAKLSSLPLSRARELGAEFGLDIVEIEPLELGSVNSNFRLRTRDEQRYFARIYEEQPRAGAEVEIELLLRLSAEGVPVVRPLGIAAGGNLSEDAGKPFAIFPWVDGVWLCLQRVTRDHCRLVGEALARVHRAEVPREMLGAGRFRPRDMLERLSRVRRTDPGRLEDEIAFIERKYAEYGARRDAALPSGICHGDLFRDNVLWQGPSIAALLDFESVSLGSFVYDLMVTVFAWCYRDELVAADAEAMIRGYHSVRPLSLAELQAFEVEAALCCLRFATSRITDFELRRRGDAPPGRDFRRFLGRLAAVEAGVLGPARDRLRAEARLAPAPGRDST